MVFWNVLLGVFNLLPIPPLDGSSLLTVLLPPSRRISSGSWTSTRIFLLLGLLFLAPNLLSPIVLAVLEAISVSLVWSSSRCELATGEGGVSLSPTPTLATIGRCAELPGVAVPAAPARRYVDSGMNR